MLLIRPETPADYATIATIHVRAFGQRSAEAVITALLRQRTAFDPALALVAEIDGQVVGHALFSPTPIRLLGQDVRAVNLAPIGIDPAHQKRGVGSALMEEGHGIARTKGYTVSFLLGHSEYYPRFGYKTGVFGVSSVSIPSPGLGERLSTRVPIESDLPMLRRLWLREEGEVDFAVDPGDTLLDWLSPNPFIQSTVYLHDGALIGYTRIGADQPAAPRVFLAADPQSARLVAGKIGGGTGAVTLPLHPYSSSAGTFGAPQCQAWDAAMACALAPSPFDAFYTQLKAGERLPGRPVWSVAFDLA